MKDEDDTLEVHDYKRMSCERNMHWKCVGKPTQNCSKDKYVTMSQGNCGIISSKLIGST